MPENNLNFADDHDNQRTTLVVSGHTDGHTDLSRIDVTDLLEALKKDLSQSVVILSSCAAALIPSKETSIEWNDNKKQYEVKLQIECPDTNQALVVANSLPILIAEKSICSCGSKLKVMQYNIARVGKEINFEATYGCPNCSELHNSVIQRLKRAAQTFWKDTKSIEVGATGVKYEKQASDSTTAPKSKNGPKE